MKQGSIKTFLFLSNNKKRTYEPDQPEDVPIQLDDSDSSPVDPTPTTPTSSSCQNPERKRKRSNPDEDTTATPVTTQRHSPVQRHHKKAVCTKKSNPTWAKSGDFFFQNFNIMIV